MRNRVIAFNRVGKTSEANTCLDDGRVDLQCLGKGYAIGRGNAVSGISPIGSPRNRTWGISPCKCASSLTSRFSPLQEDFSTRRMSAGRGLTANLYLPPAVGGRHFSAIHGCPA